MEAVRQQLQPLEPYLLLAEKQLVWLRTTANAHLVKFQPVDIALMTMAAVLVMFYLLKLVDAIREHGFFRPIGLWGFKHIKKLPFVANMINKETAKVIKTLEHEVLGDGERKPIRTLPAKKASKDELVKKMHALRDRDEPKFKSGQVSGAVYHFTEELRDLVTDAFGSFAYSNPLHADVFPAVRQMEAEVVSMVAAMYNGGPEACGTMTSGGTESLLMACKAYRDWGREHRGITKPEIVVPVTAHSAFDKAGGYFGIKIVKVPVDPVTCQAIPSKMRRAVNSNTVAIVGSSPSFPHGAVDPIAELAAIARRYKIGMHVDCCLGGFLVPFMEKSGFPFPVVDFRVPGVTSISVDPHKYGFAPKGASVILYSSPSWRQFQYFVTTDWTGGIYASPSIAGSRPGALIAGTWAAMLYMGEEGYLESCREIVAAARKIEEGVRALQPDVHVVGRPQVSVVAFGSATANIYGVGDCLSKRGWNLNKLQYPSCIHICVTRLNAKKADKFLVDLAESVKEVKANPDAFKKGSAAIYGLAASIPASLVDSLARSYIDVMYKL